MISPFFEKSDHDLLLAIAAKDVQAFEMLYDRYKSRLYQYLKLTVNDQAAAEDLLAETMISVWQKASTFQHASEVSTWLFSVARHKALDFCRSQHRSDTKNKLFEGTFNHHETSGNPEYQADQKIIKNAIAKSMNLLPAEQQLVLFLTYYQGMSYQEIGALLDIPVNTVKTRVFSAKQKLKKILQPKKLHDDL